MNEGKQKDDNIQRVYCDPKSEWIHLGMSLQSNDLPGYMHRW